MCGEKGRRENREGGIRERRRRRRERERKKRTRECVVNKISAIILDFS